MASSKLPILGSTEIADPQSAEVKQGAVSAKSYAGNVAIVTLGCAKNTVDSEVMLGSFAARGFRIVSDPEKAEVIVVNTCAFLESAVEEGIDTILSLSELKKTARLRQLLVAGCMVERYREDLKKSLPEVDRFVSTDELLTVGDIGSTTGECFDQARRPYFIYDESMPRVVSGGVHSAYLKIAEGCDRPCSFCIIPKLRGKFRSRSVESITSEAKDLLGLGSKELNLIAQDLTAYGQDSKGRDKLSNLIESLSSLSDTDSFWLRLFYAYPVGVDRDLILQIAETKNVCKYLDMPLQHISPGVLKAMKRPLGGRRTRELIENIKIWAPELKLRTTFITGFPGETEEDVDLLREFVAEGHFAHVGVFTYSQEAEAESFQFSEQISLEKAEARKVSIMEAQKTVVAKHLETYLHRSEKILVEGVHAESDFLMRGRLEWQGPEVDGEVVINQFSEDFLDPDKGNQVVHSDLIGTFQTVEITEVAGYDLVGKLLPR